MLTENLVIKIPVFFTFSKLSKAIESPLELTFLLKLIFSENVRESNVLPNPIL